MRRETCYLQAGNPGSKESHYILPVKAGLLQRCLPLLSGKSSPSALSANSAENRCGSQHSQNTLLRLLFSWNGIVCPRNVFYTALKQQGNIIFGTWILAPKGKNSFIPLWKQVVSASNLPPKPQWVIFLFITISALIKYLRFPKETGCLSLLAGELSLEYSLI